ncbi:MAG: DUF4345 domain-containing protein [Rhizobiales bacterium 63-7]|nr:DUF4345 domain-containing protein [Hyphomicrobiales bacterium]OJU67762.1 MAG: DUF4345 domain-containing protein [Rhizobiales bacterium 63-7]
MEFYFPAELGERLAFGAAAFVALAGFFMMFAPGLTFRILGLQTREGRASAYGEARSMLGGFYLGTGLAAIILAQPMVYFALGSSFALATFARVISILSDRGGAVQNLLLLIAQAVLATLPLLYVFGWV